MIASAFAPVTDSGGSCFPEIAIGKHMGNIRRIFARKECSGHRRRSYFGVLSLAVRWASAIWCEDHRQMSNGAGAQYRGIIGLVAKNKPSVDFLWVFQRKHFGGIIRYTFPYFGKKALTRNAPWGCQ
jgi:hypothetical protein